MHLDTHTHSTKSMALVSVHTWCCTNIPQHISVRQETTTHVAIAVCAHTHTHFSFSIVCVARTVCVSRLHCSSWAKHTHTYAYKDTVSLPTVNSLLYNVHLLKHMEGQVILNERKHLSMLLFSCWACGDKTFQFKLSEYRKKKKNYIFSFAVFGLSEALYCIQ